MPKSLAALKFAERHTDGCGVIPQMNTKIPRKISAWLGFVVLTITSSMAFAGSSETRELAAVAAIAKEATTRAGLASDAKVDFVRKPPSNSDEKLARSGIAHYSDETVWFSPRFELADEPYRSIVMQASRKFGFDAVAMFFLAHEYCHAGLFQARQDQLSDISIDPRTKETLRVLDDCEKAAEEVFCDVVAVASLEALRHQGREDVPEVRDAAAFIKTGAFKAARKIAPNETELARKVFRAQEVAVSKMDSKADPQEEARKAVAPFCSAVTQGISIPSLKLCRHVVDIL